MTSSNFKTPKYSKQLNIVFFKTELQINFTFNLSSLMKLIKIFWNVINDELCCSSLCPLLFQPLSHAAGTSGIADSELGLSAGGCEVQTSIAP